MAAWIATTGKVTVADASHWPTSTGGPAAAIFATGCEGPSSSRTRSPSRVARRISACSRACSGPSVAISNSRSRCSVMPGTLMPWPARSGFRDVAPGMVGGVLAIAPTAGEPPGSSDRQHDGGERR